MKLEITSYRGMFLVRDLFGRSEATSGDKIQIGEGIALTLETLDVRKTSGLPPIWYFNVELANGVSEDFAANRVYEVLRNKFGGEQSEDSDIVEIKFTETEIVFKRHLFLKTKQVRIEK